MNYENIRITHINERAINYHLEECKERGIKVYEVIPILSDQKHIIYVVKREATPEDKESYERIKESYERIEENNEKRREENE